MLPSAKFCLLILSILALSSSILCVTKTTVYYNCWKEECPSKEPSWSYVDIKLDGKIHYYKLSCNEEVMCFKGSYTDNTQSLSYYASNIKYSSGSNPCFEAEAGYAEPPQGSLYFVSGNATITRSCSTYNFGSGKITSFYFMGKKKAVEIDILGLIISVIAVIIIICLFFCLICCAFGCVIAGLYVAGCVTGFTDCIQKKISDFRKNQKEKRKKVLEELRQRLENAAITKGLQNMKEEASDAESDQ